MSKELPNNVKAVGSICMAWMLLLLGLTPFLSAIDVIPNKDSDFGGPRWQRRK